MRCGSVGLWLLLGCSEQHGPTRPEATSVHAAKEPAPIVRPHVACDELVCFEAALTLGEGMAVKLVRGPQRMRDGIVQLPLQPRFADALSADQLKAEGVDLVIARGDAVERYRSRGMTVAAWEAVPPPSDFDRLSFVDGHMRNMQAFAKLLGPEAEERARRWTDYVHAKVSFVWMRTRYRVGDQSPRTLYADAAHGGEPSPYIQAYAQLGGANLARPRARPVREWNPELIFLAPGGASIDPQWRSVHAVTHHAVFTLPATPFAWDDGPESVLLMLWVAKHAQPALFRDLDLHEEVRAYYEAFYDVHLDAEHLGRLLGDGL